MKDFEEDAGFEEGLNLEEEKLEEFTRKMEELGKKMELYGRKIGETVQKVVEKNLANLKIEFPHIPQPEMPPEPLSAPWSNISLNSEHIEREHADVRAPMERIIMLKEMLDKGMITEIDFENKRKQIIDEI